jgi:sarcosine oxidase
MGASAAWALAKRSKGRVTVLDAGHAVRGSWGETRSAHLAQTDPLMMRSAQLSFAGYDALERATARSVCVRGGGRVNIGPAGSLSALQEAYAREGISHVLITADVAPGSAPPPPGLVLPRGEEALLIPDSRIMLASEATAAVLEAAEAEGAKVAEGTSGTVVSIDCGRRRITTDDGSTLVYDALVLATGAWTNGMLATAGLPPLPLVVTEEQTVRFRCDESVYAAGRFPSLAFKGRLRVGAAEDGGEDFSHGEALYLYATPHVEGGQPGYKVGLHQQGPIMDTEEFILRPLDAARIEAGRRARGGLRLESDAADASDGRYLRYNTRGLVSPTQSGTLDGPPLAACRAFVRRHLPRVDADTVELFMRCLYTNTPDGDFCVGRANGAQDIFVCAGFSGEGFKHAPAMGELVADLVLGRRGACDERNCAQNFLDDATFREMRRRFDPTRFDEC